MNRGFISLISWCILLLVVTVQVHAQPPPLPDPDWQDWRSPPGMEFRGQMEKGNPLELLRIWKMTEFLELDEDQAIRFFPALQRHRQEIQAVDSATIALSRKIIERIDGEEVTRQQVNQWRQEFLTYHQEKLRQEQNFLESLPKYMSPKQQAKYLIFERRFQQTLIDLIEKRGRLQNSRSEN